MNLFVWKNDDGLQKLSDRNQQSRVPGPRPLIRNGGTEKDLWDVCRTDERSS